MTASFINWSTRQLTIAARSIGFKSGEWSNRTGVNTFASFFLFFIFLVQCTESGLSSDGIRIYFVLFCLTLLLFIGTHFFYTGVTINNANNDDFPHLIDFN